MKKKLFSRLSVLIALVIMVSGCSKKATGYTQVIPADATAVVVVDINALANKAGVNDAENKELKEKLFEAMRSGLSAASLTQLDKILKDPDESGISVKDPVYMFMSPTFDTPVFVLKVTDDKKLRTTFDVMVTEGIIEGITENKGYSQANMGLTAMAYNNTALMVATAAGKTQQEMIGKLLNNEEKSTVKDNEYYQLMEKRKGDVVFFATMNVFSRDIIRQVKQSIPYEFDPNDFVMLGDFGFEKGKIIVRGEYATQNEEMKAMIEKQARVMSKINGSMLKEYPQSPLAFFAFNFNGEGLLNMLKEHEDFRKGLDELAEMPQIEEVIKAFKGDVSGGMFDVSMTGMPTFMAFAEVANSDIIDLLYENKQSLGLGRREDIVKLGEKEYMFSSREINLYFGAKDNVLYATNDQALCKNIGNNKGQSLKDARYASAIKGKTGFFVIDLEAIAEMPLIRMMASMGKEYTAYYNILKRFSYMEINSKNEKEGEFVLYMTDRETNALKQIVDLAKEYSGI
ncbi:DUF4836 family protein [Bacteroides sp. OttesenSCG-928-E20]|nr:DUF4836 family protein [Bacteroides sp. OttesenSCG-928-E20]MDL2305050.1 DUF4836 family protein [Bacteroides sp. OttesenSCG-928-D19]